MQSPTLAGYIDFLRTYAEISTVILPDNSYWIGASYNLAITMVNTLLQCVPNPDPTYPSLYALAVYNFATDRLLNIAQDPPGAPVVPGTTPPMTYFDYMRQSYKLYAFVAGVVTNAYDNGTGTSLTVPNWAKDMSLLELQLVKTPWGQAYLAIAQQLGETDWGLS